MIAAELLDLVPDDDADYLARLHTCHLEQMHPAVAAVQAHYDVHYHAHDPHRRKDAS